MKLSLAFFLALATIAVVVSEAALTRERRSVNFTPSWGKRSSLGGPQILASPAFNEGSRCLNRGIYLEMLIETLKVSCYILLTTILGALKCRY